MGGSATDTDARGGWLARGGQKGGLKASLTAQIAAEIEALIGKGFAKRIDFEAIETAIRHKALEIAGRAVEQRLNADHSDYTGSQKRCECGATARYVERRAKRFVTALGELSLERAYYHCQTCGAGSFPRDQALGMSGQSISPAVLRMIRTLGAVSSFEQGSELLRELAGVYLDAKRVERSAEAIGAEMSEDEQRRLQPACDSEIAETMYLARCAPEVVSPQQVTEASKKSMRTYRSDRLSASFSVAEA